MAHLHICLFGEFSISWGGAPLTGLKHPRRQALLAYLLLHRDQAIPRRRLAFLFWPDSDEEQAHTNLRNLLFKLRQDLPEPDRFLAVDAQTVQWRVGAPYTLDVAEFEAATRAAGVLAAGERAAQIYRGDLLPNCYDEWIGPIRERLRQMAQQVLTQVVAELAEQRELLRAIGYAQQLRQIEPLNEETCRTLMRLHAANDDRAGALHVYHRFVGELQDELGVEPAAATQAVYRRLFHTTPMQTSSAVATPNQAPLVGRDDEWRRMLAAWKTAAGGSPLLLAVVGEAGTGKTRLAAELLAAVHRQGHDTARAHCYAAEGALAFAPLAAWLRGDALQRRLADCEPYLAAEAARLAPDLVQGREDLARPAAAAERWQRQRMFEALARLVSVPGEPILLVLDDVQWCDRDTLEWLHYLLRFDPKAPILIVATLRAEEALANPAWGALAAAVRQSGNLVEIAVEPLTAAQTAQLAEHLAPGPLTLEQQCLLYQESEGFPLFVVELVRAGWGTAGQPDGLPDELPDELPDGPAGGEQRGEGGPRRLPAKMQAVLDARLAQLSPAARGVAETAAAIGRAFRYPVLARACEQPEDALVHSLDELWQRRVVREQGAEDYDFTHDKLRAAVYAGLSTARRRLVHRRVAQALASVYAAMPDTVCGQVAAQYEQGGAGVEAIPYYYRAAQAAQRVYANEEAVRYDRHALALWAQVTEAGADDEPGRQVVRAIGEHLGDVLHLTGHYSEARAAYTGALGLTDAADGLQTAHLLRKIGNTWREQYAYPAALEYYAAARTRLETAGGAGADAGTTPWAEAWIEVALDQSLVYYWQGDIAAGDSLLGELGPRVETQGTLVQRAHYYHRRASMAFRRNRVVGTEETVALAHKMLAAHEEAGNEAGIPAAMFFLGFQLLWQGRPEAGAGWLRKALHLAERMGDVSLQARCLTYLTIAHRLCGDGEEVRRQAARSLQVAEMAQMPEYIGTAKANQAWLAWRAGDGRQAEALGRAAVGYWDKLPAGHASAPFQWTARLPLLAVALHRGQLPAALAEARTLLLPPQQALAPTLAAALEEALAAGDAPDGAVRAAEHLARAVAVAQELRLL